MIFKEDNLQMSACEYFDSLNLLWFHCANERKTSKQAGLRLKKKGVKSGVPDCIILEPKGKYIGLFIELKIKPNKPTKNQLLWLEELSKRGYKTEICYNIDEIIEVTTNYLKL